MIRSALAAVLLVPFAAAAQPCGPAGGTRVESPRYMLGFRADPGKVSVGGHFALELFVCPKAGVRAPESVRVDASMPEHRHGMNYKAKVVLLDGGRYKAEGLMFHMPGRWELVFDLRSDGKTDRLKHSIVLE